MQGFIGENDINANILIRKKNVPIQYLSMLNFPLYYVLHLLWNFLNWLKLEEFYNFVWFLVGFSFFLLCKFVVGD